MDHPKDRSLFGLGLPGVTCIHDHFGAILLHFHTFSTFLFFWGGKLGGNKELTWQQHLFLRNFPTAGGI